MGKAEAKTSKARSLFPSKFLVFSSVGLCLSGISQTLKHMWWAPSCVSTLRSSSCSRSGDKSGAMQYPGLGDSKENTIITVPLPALSFRLVLPWGL